MIEFLNQLDTDLFLKLNGCHNSSFDLVMFYISSKSFWIWFYLILLYLIIRKYKKGSFLILVFVAVLITLSDQTSVHLFKNIFQRLRPCHNEDLMLLVHTLGNCGGKYGFVSSHATNSFALAFFVSGMLDRTYKWMPYLVFTWAALVSYSRIYLGVHYPGDVVGGALLGILIGWLVLTIYRLIVKKIQASKAGSD